MMCLLVWNVVLECVHQNQMGFDKMQIPTSTTCIQKVRVGMRDCILTQYPQWFDGNKPQNLLGESLVYFYCILKDVART